MTDTSTAAVTRLANELRRAGHSERSGILPVVLALLAERDAALAVIDPPSCFPLTDQTITGPLK